MLCQGVSYSHQLEDKEAEGIAGLCRPGGQSSVSLRTVTLIRSLRNHPDFDTVNKLNTHFCAGYDSCIYFVCILDSGTHKLKLR